MFPHHAACGYTIRKRGKKMFSKKVLKACLLFLTMTALFIGAAAVLADDVTYYDVYVAGRQITSANASDVFGDGTVSYESRPWTHPSGDVYENGAGTLTLNNVDINDWADTSTRPLTPISARPTSISQSLCTA